MELESDSRPVRIAAAGDVHCRPGMEEAVQDAFAAAARSADAILLAGDLTTHGEPEQAAVLAHACSQVDVPVVAVLGNHDCHAGKRDDVVAVLREGGVVVLDPGAVVLEVDDREVGIVGTKGFVGGFPGSHLPDFGEPLLRRVYAQTTAEVEALDRGLSELATCALRIVLLHYAPTTETIVGERPEIWTFLGTDRLAAPIIEHEPHLVLHGHAHTGTFEGSICDVPVFNVSVPVMGRDFAVFEVAGAGAATAAVH